MLVLLVAASILAAGAGKAQAHMCYETVNPAGNPAVGNNGQNDPLYGNDAVPGGRDTKPGSNGNGPLNSDGFYAVWGYLFSGNTPITNAAGSSNFWGGGTLEHPQLVYIKYTQAPGSTGVSVKKMGGPNSAISYHITGPGDLGLGESPNGPPTQSCLVPPPPF